MSMQTPLPTRPGQNTPPNQRRTFVVPRAAAFPSCGFSLFPCAPPPATEATACLRMARGRLLRTLSPRESLPLERGSRRAMSRRLRSHESSPSASLWFLALRVMVSSRRSPTTTKLIEVSMLEGGGGTQRVNGVGNQLQNCRQQ